MMRCLPICGRRKQEDREKEVKKVEKDKDEEILRKLVSRRFWRWKKVFGKRESERIPVQKSCNRVERRIYAKKGEGILTVKGEKGESASICGRLVEKGIYSPF